RCRRHGLESLSRTGGTEAVVAVLFRIAGSAFVRSAARSIPVTARLVAVWIAVARLAPCLDNFRSDVVERFALNVRIFLDLLSLTASEDGHVLLLRWEEQIPSPKSQTQNPKKIPSRPWLGIWGLGFGLSLRRTLPVHHD